MAQQPNVEITPEDLPRPTLQPGPARRRGNIAPGMILSPAQKPTGAAFGTPGPDTGWALRIISESEIPEDSTGLRKVLAALMGARAAHFGRAPTPDDLEVALLLVGLGRQRSESLDQRRHRWIDSVAHEKSPGRSAVADLGDVLFFDIAHADVMMRR